MKKVWYDFNFWTFLYKDFQWITLILYRWYFNVACLAFWGLAVKKKKKSTSSCKHCYFLQEVCDVFDRESCAHVFTRVKCYWSVHLSSRRSSGDVHAVICATVSLSDPKRPHDPSDRETTEGEKRATERAKPVRVNYTQTVYFSVNTLTSILTHAVSLSSLPAQSLSAERVITEHSHRGPFQNTHTSFLFVVSLPPLFFFT